MLDGIEDSEERWSVTREGVERVIGWCRFQLQMCELTHAGNWWAAQDSDTDEDGHDTHRVAFLVFVLMIPWAQYFGIQLETGGENDYEQDDREEAGEGFDGEEVQ